MRKKRYKQVISNMISFFVLVIILCFVFHEDYQKIIVSIADVSKAGILLLSAMGIGYLLLNVASYYVMVKAQFSSFTIIQAIEFTLLGTFVNVATSSAGTIPLQSLYLYHNGIEVGAGVSTMVLESVFHKTAVFLYALTMYLLHINWIEETIPEITQYIWMGFLVSSVIICGMICICTWKPLQQFLLKILQKLPDTEKWNKRKKSWSDQIQILYHTSMTIFHDRTCCFRVIFIHIIKLFWVYSIPYICMRILGMTGIAFEKVQVLSSLMFLIAGVLPSVAGMGPAELSYMELFSPYIGRIMASSSLILYRIANYFLPFALSICVVLRVKRRLKLKSIQIDMDSLFK